MCVCVCKRSISRVMSILYFFHFWNDNFVDLGVGTKIEPTLCRADRLVGQVLGAVGYLPKIFIELEISYYLLKRLLGVRMEGDKKAARVSVFDCSNMSTKISY